MEYFKNPSAVEIIENNKLCLENMIENMTWNNLVVGMKLSFCLGEGIKGIIKEFNMPMPSHYCETNRMAPFNFFGLRVKYSNVHIQLYFVDQGDIIVPIASKEIDIN